MSSRVRRVFAGFILFGCLGGAGWIIHQQVGAAESGWGPMIQQARAIHLPMMLLPMTPTWDAPTMTTAIEPGGVLVLNERRIGVTLREAVHPLSVGDPDVTDSFSLPEWGQIKSSTYHAPGGRTIQMYEGHRDKVYISLIVTTNIVTAQTLTKTSMKTQSAPPKDVTKREAMDLLNHLQLESVR